MATRTSLPLHPTELGCPPNCNPTLKQKRKKQNTNLKKTCNKKFKGSCKVKNRSRKRKVKR